MAALEVLALNTTVPRIEAPQTGDTYTMPRAIAIAPDGLTGSAATTSFDVTQTWNTSGTPTALKLNVTDTASNAASNLLDLQVGGASRFQVNKAGVVKLNNGGTITWTDANDLLFFSGAGYQRIRAYSVWGSGYQSGIGDNGTPSPCAVHLASSVRLGWTSGALVNLGTYDVFLQRDAAATLAQRDGTNAQTFRIYNTFTDASNYERGFMRWSSNVFEIGPEAAGTGSNRVLRLMGGGNAVRMHVNGADRWEFNNAGHFVASADNAYDIGASGATRPRNVYVGTTVQTPEVLTGNIKTTSGGGGLQFTSATLASLTQSLVAASGVAIPAGGTVSTGLMVSSAANFGVFFGSGAPTLTAAKGSLYLRSDGSTTNDRMYVNTDGSTTWTAVTTAA
jgi:hypothetical protein